MTYFDKIENYDDEIPHHIAEYLLKKKTERIVSALRKYSDRESLLYGLDLGCGTGHHLNSLNCHNTDWQIIGLDYSKKQLGWTRKKYTQSELINGSATALPFEDRKFDFVYAINSLHHLESKQDQQNAFEEVHRILKVRGLFIIHEMNTTNPLVFIFMRYIFPKLRSIDKGDEIWLTKKQVEIFTADKFSMLNTDYFTMIPFSFPQSLLPFFIRVDGIFDHSPLSYFGAHVMYIYQKME